jgi:DNA-binding MarR family transcriptional regulator
MVERFYTVDNLEAVNSVGYLVKRCGILMTQIAERRFESEPISFTQWIVLMQLAQHGSLSPTELSVHLGHDMGALTRIVDDLKDKKLVLRERSELDRRAVAISVTPEGRRLALATRPVVVELINQLVTPFSHAEVEGLIALMQRMLGHMQEFAGGQAGVLDPLVQGKTPPRRKAAAASRSSPRHRKSKS